jgi:ATP-dependent Lon protease
MATSSIAVRELPLFPLPEVVLFPGRPLPLHIFEFRYRIMMNTILEEDRRFGVLMVDPATGEIAKVGSCAEVVRCQRLPDDRLKILTIGQQRFRVLEYVREKPYRVGLVEWRCPHHPRSTTSGQRSGSTAAGCGSSISQINRSKN